MDNNRISTTFMLTAIDDAYAKHCPQPEPFRPMDLCQSTSKTTLDLCRVKSALFVLDPDCAEATWKLLRLAVLARAAREHPELADELYRLAKSWSSGELRGKAAKAWTTPGNSNGLTGEDAFEIEWNRFLDDNYSGNQTTLGTIYHDAKEAGWKDPDQFQVEKNGTTIVNLQKKQKLSPAGDNEALIQTALEVISGATDMAKNDSGAALEDDVIHAMANLRQHSMADYQRCRERFKQANKTVSVLAIDQEVERSLQDENMPETHHSYAKNLLVLHTIDGNDPVSHNGELYAFDLATGLWEAVTVDSLARKTAETFDGRNNCKRTNDYNNIANHAITLAADPLFFDDAAIGLACPGGFIRVHGDSVSIQPLTAAHRQRIKIGFTPQDIPTPLFDTFLKETFQSDTPDEKEQQIALIQEVVGAFMLGIAHRYQKAFMFYDPHGRAGKGTLERCIRGVVPEDFVTAISPFNWNKEYYLASLAGSLLNVVGELPEQDSIPSAAFKTVTGGDLLTGRHPSHRTITFRNEAGHLFMSNHLINTRDHSEAFYSRWIIIGFPNSRLRLGLSIDPSLADNIIKDEMPGIAHWALQGAKRLLMQQAYSSSIVHDRLMAKWRHTANSVEEFIHEECELCDASIYIRRSVFYSKYSSWCKENGRKPFAKGRVKELLEHNLTLGITHSSLNGYEIFRGVRMKSQNCGPVTSLQGDVN